MAIAAKLSDADRPPPLTQDVDVLVVVPYPKAPAMVEALAAAGFLLGDLEPRPLDLRAVLGALRSAHLVVLQVQGVRVELFAP